MRLRSWLISAWKANVSVSAIVEDLRTKPIKAQRNGGRNVTEAWKNKLRSNWGTEGLYRRDFTRVSGTLYGFEFLRLLTFSFLFLFSFSFSGNWRIRENGVWENLIQDWNNIIRGATVKNAQPNKSA